MSEHTDKEQLKSQAALETGRGTEPNKTMKGVKVELGFEDTGPQL